MTTPSEQWIVSALRQATDRMPLPPESRWIRERRSTPRAWTIAVVGAAIFIVAVGVTIGALRVEPRLAPAAGSSAFVEAEDREWRIARFVITPDLVLLRPAWIPAEYRGSVECPSPWALTGTGATPSRTSTSGYLVEYRGRVLPDWRPPIGPLGHSDCALLQLYGQLGTRDGVAGFLPEVMAETGTVDARGTTVHVRSGVLRMHPDAPPSLPQIFVWHLWWNESGAQYDVISYDTDLELVDLIRVIRSLEPMR